MTTAFKVSATLQDRPRVDRWNTALLGTTVQQFVREKLTLIFYLAAWKMITAADSKADLKKILCWLIISKAQPNFYSMDNSIQGTLSSVLRVSPD